MVDANPLVLGGVFPEESDGTRLDRATAALLGAAMEGLSRAQIQRLIKDGHVCLNGVPCLDPSQKVRAGMQCRLTIPAPRSAGPEPQALSLPILYEDSDLLVLDKPPGLVVHPAAGHRDGTLVNALLAHCGDSLSGIGGERRPGIVHRLDKDTGGLMVVAKNDAAHQALAAQFQDRTLSRTYHALVWGVPNPTKGVIEGAIGRHPRHRQRMAMVARGGKAAETHYKLLTAFGARASLLECRLKTGRTHQIRVHMAHIGCPLVGDPLYGKKRIGAVRAAPVVRALAAFPRQALHAVALQFIHPRTGAKEKFETDLPNDMRELIAGLSKTL